ncbi:60S ribosomal protein L29-like [Vombatus ursinus]|uniref:60S ribosomal protein L29-like n=1 Tax=Vombatus ursinus TaxID=29139 RepID=UPI000FFD4765|nr:60S ribosomal protein L29-like [Vombatus ursinus]XP_027704309.1 60S ribosomal protein L29-like [Vombatus ursinus]
MHMAKKYNKKGLKKMQVNNTEAIMVQVETIKSLSTKASKVKFLRPKISEAAKPTDPKVTKSDNQGHKSDPKATKSDSKVMKLRYSKAAKPTDPKPAESISPKGAKPKDAGAKATSSTSLK